MKSTEDFVCRVLRPKRNAALATEKKMKTPEFKNLKEERTFWDTHDATDYLDDFEEAPDMIFAREKK
jgi:hypothetical protein